MYVVIDTKLGTPVLRWSRLFTWRPSWIKGAFGKVFFLGVCDLHFYFNFHYRENLKKNVTQDY